ncbi:MAG TPA: hypothetical protein VJ508_12745, partial [Saprospiraceae bacterium]|nr:hypothetical protein [Saprospiraceae bacterium]
MGLFAFMKGAGKPVLAKKEEEKAAAVSAEELNKKKIEAMTAAVNKLNLPLKDFSILLNSDVVTAYGQAQTQFD